MENRARVYRQLGEEYDTVREKSLVSEESLEEGGTADSNFVNYQSPAIEDQNTI